MKSIKITDRKSQGGMATLIVSVALLFAITIIILLSARTNVMEQRIAANDYRGKQAFEAAEAGLEFMIGRMNKESIMNLSSGTSGSVKIFCADDDDEPSESCEEELPNKASYTAELRSIDTELTTIEVTSIGLSDDLTASRLVKVIVKLVPLVGNTPPTPLVARGEINLVDFVTISNPETGSAIWSGGDITPTPLPPTVTIDNTTEGNQSNLANATDNVFFENFFQSTAPGIKAQSKLITLADNGGSTNYSDKLKQTITEGDRAIWVDAENADGTPGAVVINSGPIGSDTEPVVLIIDGFSDLTIADGVDIYGLVYIADAWNNGVNSANIYGSVIVENNVILTGAGVGDELQIRYTAGATSILDKLDDVGRYSKIPGSWRDFELE